LLELLNTAMGYKVNHKYIDAIKLYKWKVLAYFSVFLTLFALVCMILFQFYGESYINKKFKTQIIKEFNKAAPNYSISINELNFKIFGSRIDFKNIAINSNDSTLSGTIDKFSISGINCFKIIWSGSIDNDILASSMAEAEKIAVRLNKSFYEISCDKLNMSLPDSSIIAYNIQMHPFITDEQFFDESEYSKSRIIMFLSKLKTKGINWLGILQSKFYHANKIQINDVAMDLLIDNQKPEKIDTNNNDVVSHLFDSFKDIIKIDSISFLNGNIKYAEKSSDISNPDKGYDFSYSSILMSLKDSLLVTTDLSIKPLVDDYKYFDESRYRRTRFKLDLPQFKVIGLDYHGLLSGKKYFAHNILITKAFLDLQADVYKPYKKEKSKTPMPNEMMAMVKEIIHIDSINIYDSQIRYEELYAARSKPALLTIDNLNASISGITNDRNNGDTAVLKASALLMSGAISKLTMHVPLTSPKFTMEYSGTLGQMKMDKINAFLVIAEHMRIKTGEIMSIKYKINVKNDRAKGYVHGIYKDFSLAILDKNRSEKNIGNKITSFFANNFKINGTNIKGDYNTFKLGKVNYLRKHDDTFIQVSWFGVRNGAGDMLNIQMK
jgi:hypothetical protein